MRKYLLYGVLLAVLILSVLPLASCDRLHRHKFSDWIYTTEPTCVETGEKYRECECGEREVVAVAPLGVHTLKDNVCTMCHRNLNPYFFNLFKSLISDEYPLFIKELSFYNDDKTKYFSFKNTELIVNVDDSFDAQLIGTCELTETNSLTVKYDFTGVVDGEWLYAKLLSTSDESTTPYYLSIPLCDVEINSEPAALEQGLRENALLKHSSTLSLLINVLKEWRKSTAPAIITFAEEHFDTITPFLNDYFTSLFTVSLVDGRVGLELNFSKIKEFNNSVYNESVSTLYEKITKAPYGEIEGRITSILNTQIGELMRTAEEESIDVNETLEYCFSVLYNLRVTNSAEVPEDIYERLNNEEYTSRSLLSLVAELLEKSEEHILDETKNAITQIGNLSGYQYVYRLIEGKGYSATSDEENARIRDVYNSINSRLVSFASLAHTSFTTDGLGNFFGFKMTFRAGGSTVNLTLDKERTATAIADDVINEIISSTALTREGLKALLSTVSGASIQGNTLIVTAENVNDNLQNQFFIKEFDLSECLIIYSPSESGTTEIILVGAAYEEDENGNKLNTDATYTTLTLVYNPTDNTVNYQQ